MLTKYGRNQTIRESTGNVQPNLFLYKIREIIIPVFEENFQNTVQNAVIKSRGLLKKSDEAYCKAKSFTESFGSTGRLDAEYYLPKYDSILTQIKSYRNGYHKLMDIVTEYSTGFAFSSDSYSDNGIPLVRITNISQGRLDLSNAQRIPYDCIASGFKDYAQEGDILISMSGSIGLSCVIPANTEVVVNQRIMRITQTSYNSNVLSMLINSPIINEQLLRIGTGGVQTNISATDIGNVIVPKLDSSIEKQLTCLIVKSISLRNNADKLLECTKQAVEMAIEQDEATAITWLNSKF